MRILEHIVTPAEDGQRVKHLLRSRWQLSTTLLKHLKWNGGILLNGRSVPVNTPAHTGDVLTADVSDPPGSSEHICPVDFPLDILYEDEDLLVLNKPAGIAIHSAALTEETGLSLDPSRTISQMTITEQKMVELLRIFDQKPELLIIRGLSSFVSVYSSAP